VLGVAEQLALGHSRGAPICISTLLLDSKPLLPRQVFGNTRDLALPLYVAVDVFTIPVKAGS
jgi:hypothetical protein